MEIIDKIKSVGCETYKFTAEKTSKIAKETKLRMKINQNKSAIEDLYEEIGKVIYENHIREEEKDVTEKVNEICIKINAISNEIDELGCELLTLKDKKKCDDCSYEMEIKDKFCPKCGKEQPKVEVKEVEIVNEEEKAEPKEEVIEEDVEEESKTEEE